MNFHTCTMNPSPSIRPVGIAICAAVAAFELALPLAAQDTPTVTPIASRDPLIETGSERDHLLGDFGGARSRMVEKGIHLQAGYIGEVMANVSGGVRRGAAYNGLAQLAVDLDFEKLAKWQGASLRASSLWLHGDSPSGKFIGDAQTASNIEGYDSIRLYEFWFEQNFWDDRVSLRLGNLLADAEFAFTDYGGLFFNSAFGWPGFVSGNTLNTGPAFYVTATGARLRIDASESIYFQVAMYDGDTFDDPGAGDARKNANGTRLHFSADQGTFSMYEFGYKLNQAEGATGLPGDYKVGAWLHTGLFADNYRDVLGGSFIVSGLAPQVNRNNFGLYVTMQQMVWREDLEQGLGVFFRAGGGPADRSAFEYVMDGGLHYTGLIPGRDFDSVGIGVAYAQMSGDLARQQRDDRDINGTPIPAIADYELAIEVTYEAVIKPWWTIQPSVQWVIHPGGSGAIQDAVVMGLRTSITF